MIVVDTTVWVGYFNGDDDWRVARLEAALDLGEDTALLPVIVTEVLQGFRSDSGFRRARAVLLRVPMLVPSVHAHVRAAELFRRLRSRGVTVRGAIDCIIAQACIDYGAALLSLDGDFERIAAHSSLELCRE